MRQLTKEQVPHEIQEILGTFLYLALFFCAFSAYRELVLSELGLGYYHFGFALIKALVLAKVIVLGQHVRFGKILDDWPLIIPTIYKVVFFSIFALLFDVLEHIVEALLHGRSIPSALQEIISVGRDEILARGLVVLIAVIPFFAVEETGRRLGEGVLSRMFYQKIKSSTKPT